MPGGVILYRNAFSISAYDGKKKIGWALENVPVNHPLQLHIPQELGEFVKTRYRER